MYFFVKNKPIIVDTFTTNSTVYEFAEIKPAIHFLPQWWKNLPSKYTPDTAQNIELSTIKKCAGFVDNYKNGFIMPLWCDLQINSSPTEWSVRPSLSNVIINPHDKQQYGPKFDDYWHMKIVSPWIFREKTGVKFVWTQPIWNMIGINENIMFAPGIMEYKYQHSTNINLFLSRKNSDFLIEYGTPLVHIFPLSEKPIEIRNHLVDTVEYLKMGGGDTNIKFNSVYKAKVKTLKSKERKCPFTSN